jgi:1-acyl-sn-glycerol-3-phosphate acyltransferase
MSDSVGTFRLWTEVVTRSAFRAVWGVKTSGMDGIPRSGPLIVASNHFSVIDPPLLASVLAPARKVRFMGKKELFERRNQPLGWFLMQMGSIPLDRSGADMGAMREALEVLGKDGCLGIFPEGTRVKPGEKRAPKLGVSFLAAKTGARVLPVRVQGTAEFPRAFPLEVRCGSPLPPPAEGREAASSFARAVMEAIYAL